MSHIRFSLYVVDSHSDSERGEPYDSRYPILYRSGISWQRFSGDRRLNLVPTQPQKRQKRVIPLFFMPLVACHTKPKIKKRPEDLTFRPFFSHSKAVKHYLSNKVLRSSPMPSRTLAGIGKTTPSPSRTRFPSLSTQYVSKVADFAVTSLTSAMAV